MSQQHVVVQPNLRVRSQGTLKQKAQNESYELEEKLEQPVTKSKTWLQLADNLSDSNANEANLPLHSIYGVDTADLEGLADFLIDQDVDVVSEFYTILKAKIRQKADAQRGTRPIVALVPPRTKPVTIPTYSAVLQQNVSRQPNRLLVQAQPRRGRFRRSEEELQILKNNKVVTQTAFLSLKQYEQQKGITTEKDGNSGRWVAKLNGQTLNQGDDKIHETLIEQWQKAKIVEKAYSNVVNAKIHKAQRRQFAKKQEIQKKEEKK
jgi:hypothetical protein